MNKLFLSQFLACILLFTSCGAQQNQDKSERDIVGGPFENREWTYYQIPDNIDAIDTSLGWQQAGQKLLVTGTVFKQDGHSPAANIVLYYYQTNDEGHYKHLPDQKISMPPNNQGQTHGAIRGWVKTNAEGKYYIYTIRPGVYPSRDEPAHIHITAKEPSDIPEYYLDDFVFDDDVLLTSAIRNNMKNRGGSGILRLVKKDGILIGERDITLGLNIPNYPDTSDPVETSGRNIGEDVISFLPHHAWGEDKGTRTCPVCKYGWFHGILYFVGNQPNWKEIKDWLKFFETESQARKDSLKVYFVYGNPENYSKAGRNQELESLGKELSLERVALTFLPSLTDIESEIHLNKINPEVTSTIIIYKRNKIINKYINPDPTPDSFKKIQKVLDNSKNEYFGLPSAYPHL